VAYAQIVQRFSALQRAENSSIPAAPGLHEPQTPMFQCSSASRKFLNASVSSTSPHERAFQCSSASRKFLNPRPRRRLTVVVIVSVLFSEPKIPQSSACGCESACASVSVLFSEPKIPQARLRVYNKSAESVSVLFSEPKIPQ